MFTGLVEDTGVVVATDRAAGASYGAPGAPPGSGAPAGSDPSEAIAFAIRPQRIPLTELAVGESICHDGACLTVASIDLGDPGRGAYRVLAGAETLARTALGALAVGKRVNLERALRVGDRLGGHWVTGHVDGTGELVARRDLGANLVLELRAAPAILRYVVEKGSIAVAGVSLTVNSVDASGFSVAIIPHTRDVTSLGDLAVGDRVNLEADILAKHVEKLVKQ
jgi:riboflavin synthase